MPVVNPLAKELVLKVVYYGPGLGGKTTSLQHVFSTTVPEHRGKMVSLKTPVDRTLYFDFLPVHIPTIHDLAIRLQLFTVPGQVHYNATRKLVLTGADGVVMVFDSQPARADANLESLESLRDNLKVLGRVPEAIPCVFQYNKRDLYEVMSLNDMDRLLNRDRLPRFATTATSGEGIYETLEAMTKAVLDDFEKKTPEGQALRAASGSGMSEAVRLGTLRAPGARAPSIPPAPLPLTRTTGSMKWPAPPRLDPTPDDLLPLPEPVPRSETPLSPGIRPLVPTVRPSAESDAPDGPRVPSSIPAAVESVVSSIPPPAQGFSLEALWPAQERATVQELEQALAASQFGRSVELADRLVTRVLASAGALLGGPGDAPRDPIKCVLLLGVEGRRYLDFRGLVRDARAGKEVQELEALGAYATAVEIRVARTRLSS